MRTSESEDSCGSGFEACISSCEPNLCLLLMVYYPVFPFLALLPFSFLVSRHEFDSEQIPDLTKDVYIQDIHCVGSLCKLYFRELPNPLLTYQLYEKFSVSARWDLYFYGMGSFTVRMSQVPEWFLLLFLINVHD